VLDSVYIHVPWCAARCPYCSFNVYVDQDPPYERWADGVLRDWRRVEKHTGDLRSVYFGGGTPSLAPPQTIARILSEIAPSTDAEITLEANPATITPARLVDFRAAGINRVSVGVQTFSPRSARLLSRGHTVHAARELVGMVAAADFTSWSVDIIFALPGQTLDELHADLDAILATGPPHVSLYGLTIKEGTPFERAHKQGRLVLPDGDTWRAQYDLIVSTLATAGIHRYEVSSFARAGHRSVHNEATWRGGHYAGLGPGAHGFLPDGTRTKMHDPLEEWLADPAGTSERPDPWQTAVDHLLSTLRHVDGIASDTLTRRTGYRIRPETVRSLIVGGLLQLEDNHLRLTEAGWPLADGITWRLCEALIPEGRLPSGSA
jgi:putative oxygen-independent coproporphyrinogen III oxidase